MPRGIANEDGDVFCSMCQRKLTKAEEVERFLFERTFCMSCRELGVHTNMEAYREAKTRHMRQKVFPEVWDVYCRIVLMIRNVKGTAETIASAIRRKTKLGISARQIEVMAKQNGIELGV